MSNCEIKLIPREEWLLLKDVYASELHSNLPEAETAHIIGAYKDGKLVGHVMAEQLVRVGLVYVSPEERGKDIAQRLLSYVVQSVPKPKQVLVLATSNTFEKLCERLGMQQLEGVPFVVLLEDKEGEG